MYLNAVIDRSTNCSPSSLFGRSSNSREAGTLLLENLAESGIVDFDIGFEVRE